MKDITGLKFHGNSALTLHSTTCFDETSIKNTSKFIETEDCDVKSSTRTSTR